MTVRAYLRVSTAKQVDGFSLAAQRDRAEAWARYQGLGDVQHYEDGGVSGKRDDRPALLMLLDDVQPEDTVVVYSLSRLGRGGVLQLLGTIKEIEDRGGRLVSLTESIDTKTPTGRLLLTILAALAEMEVEQTRERALGGKMQAALSGLWPIAGHTLPFGYKRTEEGKIAIDEREAEIVREIFRLSAEGIGVVAVAERLHAAGAYKRRKTPWIGTSVFHIRTHRYDQPYVEYTDALSGDTFKIPAPPLITEDEWHGAQRNRSRSTPYRNVERFSLTGHLYCACGARMAGQTNNGGQHLYYTCRARSRRTPTCPVVQRPTWSIRTHKAEAAAREALHAALLDPKALQLLTALEPVIDIHQEERARLEQQKSALIDLYLEQVITREEMEVRRGGLQRRIDRLKAPEPTPAPLTADGKKYAQAVLAADRGQFQGLLELLQVELEASPAGGMSVRRISIPK